MQRLARLSLNTSQQNVLALFLQFEQIKELLAKHLPPSTVNLFAEPVLKKDQIVEWYTPLQGQPQLVQGKDLPSNIKALIDQKIASLQQLLVRLNGSHNLSAEQFAILEKAVNGLSTSERQIYLVNNEPVIVGWGLGMLPKLATPAVVPTAVSAVPMSLWAKHRCCWFILLLGLLALFAALVWWWPFKPAPEIKPVEPPAKIAEQSNVAVLPKTELVIEPRTETVVEPEKVAEPKIEDVKSEPQEEIKAEEPKVTEPPKPIQVCNKNIEPAKRPQIVLVFDNSWSMLLSLLESKQSLDAAFQRLARNGGYFTDEETRYLTREPRRLTVAKKSAVSILDRIDQSLDIGLLTLNHCTNANNYGFYSPAKRGALKKKVQGLYPEDAFHSGTPLYSGLAQAAKMVDGVSRDAFILLISDGEDSCGYRQKICGLATRIAKKKPKLKINVVDIGNARAANCVASATKGKVFTANSKAGVVSMVNQAIQPMMEKEECQ